MLNPEIQKEYRRRNAGQDNLVRANDVLFAVHALILSTFTLSQTLIYKRDHDQRVSNPTKLFMLITVSGAGIILASRTIFSSSPSSQWIDLLYYLSYIKLGISFLKYCPQVYLNYTSRSTVGWSIHNILLDFTGGVLSIAQLILDAAISDDWSGISGDPVKLGLGLLSTLFDLVFMTQHYVLYRNREDRYAPVAMVEENQGEHKGLMVLFQGRKGYGSVVGDDREAEIVDDNGARRPGGSMKDLEIGR
ncbi:hypothetical protein BGZ54_005602 [Gamsiella multidivaricata]|nr:hypothetical protein BGZ54_005602 [Gamsiella multidivaricata]